MKSRKRQIIVNKRMLHEMRGDVNFGMLFSNLVR